MLNEFAGAHQMALAHTFEQNVALTSLKVDLLDSLASLDESEMMRDAVLEHGVHFENNELNMNYSELYEISDYDILYNPKSTTDCFSSCYDTDCNFMLWYVPKGDGIWGEYDLICEIVQWK